MSDLVSYALTNVSDVKESLGIASGDHSKDNLIIRKINQVTDAIEGYCQRRFTLSEYVEEYKGSQIDEIVLRQRPIVIDGDHEFLAQWRTTAFNDNDWESIDTELSFVDQASGVVNLMYNAVGHWNRYRYTYWAGYAVEEADLDAGIAGIPNDLAEAANMLACFYVNNPAGAFIGYLSKKEGNRETRFSNTNNTLSFKNIMEQLGVDETIDSYSDMPVLTDR